MDASTSAVEARHYECLAATERDSNPVAGIYSLQPANAVYRARARYRIRWTPDRIASLRLLVGRERYAFRDIADMFGVSRARIEQICYQFGITHPDKARGLKCRRVWDDDQHRFVPVSKGHIRRSLATKRQRQAKATRLRRYAERRAELVTLVRELAVELGRTPYGREISERAQMCHVAHVAQQWAGDCCPGAMQSLIRAAGLTPNRRGYQKPAA